MRGGPVGWVTWVSGFFPMAGAFLPSGIAENKKNKGMFGCMHLEPQCCPQSGILNRLRACFVACISYKNPLCLENLDKRQQCKGCLWEF